MSDWRAAFERDKHVVGRAVHEGWAAEKIRQGFADHVFRFVGRTRHGEEFCGADGCFKPKAKHHPDMLDYDDLAPNIQEYDIVTGIIGYKLGYEAGRRDAGFGDE